MAQVLIVGGGGREHALADALCQSPQVECVWMTAHNGATEEVTKLAPFLDNDKLAKWCLSQKIDLVVIGPENHLAAGIVDVLTTAGVIVLGSNRRASQLESSKVYAKNFMRRYNIPTSDFIVANDMAAVGSWLDNQSPPYVIKADGLAAGKGVEICADVHIACQTAESMLAGKYKEASKRLVLETFLEGEEVSFIVLVANGRLLATLPTCRDYKRLQTGDEGVNTGGMGVISPVPQITPDMEARILDQIILPTLAGLEKEGIIYTGFLYAGLMIQGEVLRVLEFNCRLGDPEAQVILPRLDGDWYSVFLKAALGQETSPFSLSWLFKSAVGVVLATQGYPTTPKTGDKIHLSVGVEKNNASIRLYHAATKTVKGDLITAGGRVLTVVALADSLEVARNRAYEKVNHINFEGMQYRRDIGLNL